MDPKFAEHFGMPKFTESSQEWTVVNAGWGAVRPGTVSKGPFHLMVIFLV